MESVVGVIVGAALAFSVFTGVTRCTEALDARIQAGIKICTPVCKDNPVIRLIDGVCYCDNTKIKKKVK